MLYLTESLPEKMPANNVHEFTTVFNASGYTYKLYIFCKIIKPALHIFSLHMFRFNFKQYTYG